jgi:hypothetical protein
MRMKENKKKKNTKQKSQKSTKFQMTKTTKFQTNMNDYCVVFVSTFDSKLCQRQKLRREREKMAPCTPQDNTDNKTVEHKARLSRHTIPIYIFIATPTTQA